MGALAHQCFGPTGGSIPPATREATAPLTNKQQTPRRMFHTRSTCANPELLNAEYEFPNTPGSIFARPLNADPKPIHSTQHNHPRRPQRVTAPRRAPRVWRSPARSVCPSPPPPPCGRAAPPAARLWCAQRRPRSSRPPPSPWAKPAGKLAALEVWSSNLSIARFRSAVSDPAAHRAERGGRVFSSASGHAGRPRAMPSGSSTPLCRSQCSSGTSLAEGP